MLIEDIEIQIIFIWVNCEFVILVWSFFGIKIMSIFKNIKKQIRKLIAYEKSK